MIVTACFLSQLRLPCWFLPYANNTGCTYLAIGRNRKIWLVFCHLKLDLHSTMISADCCSQQQDVMHEWHSIWNLGLALGRKWHTKAEASMHWLSGKLQKCRTLSLHVSISKHVHVASFATFACTKLTMQAEGQERSP